MWSSVYKAHIKFIIIHSHLLNLKKKICRKFSSLRFLGTFFSQVLYKRSSQVGIVLPLAQPINMLVFYKTRLKMFSDKITKNRIKHHAIRSVLFFIGANSVLLLPHVLPNKHHLSAYGREAHCAKIKMFYRHRDS